MHDLELRNEIEKKAAKAEAIMTGCILAESFSMKNIIHEIREDFFSESNKIARACIRLFIKNGRYSALLIAKETGEDIAAVNYAANAGKGVVLSDAWEFYKRIYGQLMQLRLTDIVLNGIGKDLDASEISVQCEKFMRGTSIASQPKESGLDDFQASLKLAFDGIMPDYPVKPPLESMRQMAPHHEPGELVVIGGRTGMGKSYMCINYLYDNAKRGVEGVYFNLENISKNVFKRMWQMASNEKFRNDMSMLSDFDKGRLMEEANKLDFEHISVYSGNRNLNWILTKIRQEWIDKRIKFAVIDYLQIVQIPGSTKKKYEIIGDVLAALKTIALELGIVIIVCAQLSRESEKSGDKRPRISDLRDSGDIEQDADTIMLLFRPSYYGITEGADGTIYSKWYAEILFGKGREIGTGIVGCEFNEVRGFHDPEPKSDSYPPQPNGSHYGQQQPEPPTAMRRNTKVLDEDFPF